MQKETDFSKFLEQVEKRIAKQVADSEGKLTLQERDHIRSLKQLCKTICKITEKHDLLNELKELL